ncbi:hypothetical protein L9F63_013792, partial [Diploptera punctata]
KSITICLLATLIATIKSENIQDNGVRENLKQLNNNVTDEKEGSASVFVPSFGPPQPPNHINPFLFHNFGPSPIHAYQFMFSHGYPYACTFPYSKFLAPFVPSQRDLFLDSHQPATFHYPHEHLKLPYAEHFPNYLPYNYHHLYHHHNHHETFYQPHPVYIKQHYPLSFPHISQHNIPHISQHDIPHINPHAFQSVVNYGHINLHHGDHFEPHDNGKEVPFHFQHHIPIT